MEVLNPQGAMRILEAALLSASQPMSMRDMRQLFDNVLSVDALRSLLAQMAEQWVGRGVELRETAAGWRFQTCEDVQAFLDRLNPERPAKYTRATLETLAIIAYKQPVTRGDIEDIRGVTVSSNIIKQLEDRGWVEVIGHRDAPGRPALFATTKEFLSDLGLASLAQLPTLEGLPVSQGLLPGLDDLLEDAPVEEASVDESQSSLAPMVPTESAEAIAVEAPLEAESDAFVVSVDAVPDALNSIVEVPVEAIEADVAPETSTDAAEVPGPDVAPITPAP